MSLRETIVGTRDKSIAGRYVSSMKQYQGFFHLEGKTNFEAEVLSHISAWLGEKGFELDLRSNYFKKLPTKELVVVTNKASDGKSYRVKLIERQPNGQFNVDILLHVDYRLDSWILVRVTTPESITPKPPRVVNYIIEQGLAVDGGAPLIRGSRQVRHGDIEDLVSHLIDPERRAIYFVAGTSNSMDFDSFKRDVDRWTKDTAGLAHVVVLDPVATEIFSNTVSSTFEVPPGTIRTFRPGLDLDDEFSARQHRIVGMERLRTGNSKLIGLFGHIAQVNQDSQGTPDSILSTTRRLQRVEHSFLMSLLAEQTAKLGHLQENRKEDFDNENGISLALADVTSETTTKSDIQDNEPSALAVSREVSSDSQETQSLIEYLTELVESSESKLEELENQNSDALHEIKELEYETAWQIVQIEGFEQEIHNLKKELDYLRDLLKKQGVYDVYQSSASLTSNFSVNNWDQLLEFVETSPYLEYTGDMDSIFDILEYDPNQKALNIAFLAAQSLHNYSEATIEFGFNSDMETFIKNPPLGHGYRSFPPKKHAKGESGYTREREKTFSREFPVPTEISSTGQKRMLAHFKLGGEYPTRPTLYYLDEVATHKKIIIGYIGLHLQNRLS